MLYQKTLACAGSCVGSLMFSNQLVVGHLDHLQVYTADMQLLETLKLKDTLVGLHVYKDHLVIVCSNHLVELSDPTIHLDAQTQVSRSGSYCLGLYSTVGKLQIYVDSTSFNVQLDVLDLVDFCFIGRRLLVLYQDQRECRHVSFYRLKDKKLVPTAQGLARVDPGALFLIPLDDAFIVVGQATIQYGKFDFKSVETTLNVKPAIFTNYCLIDSSRIVLADHTGLLYILAISTNEKPVLTLEPIGQVFSLTSATNQVHSHTWAMASCLLGRTLATHS
jgi:hypothetical protein